MKTSNNDRVLVFLKDQVFTGIDNRYIIPVNTVINAEFNTIQGGYTFLFDNKPSLIRIEDMQNLIDSGVMWIFSPKEYDDYVFSLVKNITPISVWDSAIVEMEIELDSLIEEIQGGK